MTTEDLPSGRDRSLCGGKNRGPQGGTCARPAGWGTGHPGTGKCKLHGGKTRNHQISAERAQVAELAAAYSVPRNIHPLQGVLEQYHRYAGQIAWLEQRVNTLPEDDLFWGVESETDRRGDEDGETAGERLRTGSAAEFERKSKAGPNALLEQFDRVQREYAKLGVDIIRIGLETASAAMRDRFGPQLGAVIERLMGEFAEAVRVRHGLSDADAAVLLAQFRPLAVEAIASFAGAPKELTG